MQYVRVSSEENYDGIRTTGWACFENKNWTTDKLYDCGDYCWGILEEGGAEFAL